MEKEGYRDNIERIKAMYPTKELLTIKEVSKFLGIDARTVKKTFQLVNGKYMSVAVLARKIS